MCRGVAVKSSALRVRWARRSSLANRLVPRAAFIVRVVSFIIQHAGWPARAAMRGAKPSNSCEFACGLRSKHSCHFVRLVVFRFGAFMQLLHVRQVSRQRTGPFVLATHVALKVPECAVRRESLGLAGRCDRFEIGSQPLENDRRSARSTRTSWRSRRDSQPSRSDTATRWPGSSP